MNQRLSHLLKQKAHLEAAIEKARREERIQAIEAIQALLQRHKITAEDLTGRPPGFRRTRAGGTAVARLARWRQAVIEENRQQERAAIQYRDTQTGLSWNGQGLTPRWLDFALRSGRKLEDFAV